MRAGLGFTRATPGFRAASAATETLSRLALLRGRRDHFNLVRGASAPKCALTAQSSHLFLANR